MEPPIQVSLDECTRDTTPTPVVGDLDGARLARLAASQGSNLEAALRLRAIEGLLHALARHDVPPSRLAAELAARIDEESLYALIDGLAGLSPYHLQGVSDVRRFASRLAALALGGTFEPLDEIDTEEGGGVGEVLFSSEQELEDPARVAAEVFPADVPVIHALIPIGEHADAQTVLKWIRLDPPEIVVFRRLALFTPGEPFYAYYPYGIRREAARRPGRYRVSVHLADDALTPIAAGAYTVE